MGSLKCFSPTISLADQLSEGFSCFYPESKKILLKKRYHFTCGKEVKRHISSGLGLKHIFV
jgi:hypothetical protein